MDKKLVHKVFTHKSGYFVFSRRFSNAKLRESLIEARILYRTIADLPILPSLSSRLEEEIVRRSIFGTAALEGNPLSEERVSEIISESKAGDPTEKAEREIQNLKAAYDFIANLQKEEGPLKVTEKLIQQIHTTVTQGIQYQANAPGRYRNHRVKVGDKEHGGVYTPPKCLPDIQNLMEEYVAWINNTPLLTENPFKRASLAHYHLALIHPFGDGNGRTARLLEALLLRTAGVRYVPVMLSNFYYRNMDDYFLTFSTTRKNKKNDVTDFLRFTLKGAVESLGEIKDKITFFIRKFTLRDFFKHEREAREITQRQLDFLELLLENHLGPFTLKDMYSLSPFNVLYRKVHQRTARRDLQRLSEKGLLLTENGEFFLNLHVLG